jgi:hypothetical protein
LPRSIGVGVFLEAMEQSSHITDLNPMRTLETEEQVSSQIFGKEIYYPTFAPLIVAE